jgi:late competence protein required for DNA uptake (superfamily II DNA/RNA helicase)
MSIKVVDKELPRECPGCNKPIRKYSGYVDYLEFKLYCRKCFMGLQRARSDQKAEKVSEGHLGLTGAL